MSTKSKSKLSSVDMNADDNHDTINDYRLLKLNAFNGQNSWDFTGRSGSHGPYPFPFQGMKVLSRKS